MSTLTQETFNSIYMYSQQINVLSPPQELAKPDSCNFLLWAYMAKTKTQPQRKAERQIARINILVSSHFLFTLTMWQNTLLSQQTLS